MNGVMQGLVAAANRDPRLTRVFSTFTASNPSIYLDIDREKAQALGLNLSDVFGALQAALGGVFINNFNLFGRVWQVNIEGAAADRADLPALWQIYIRNKSAQRALALDRRGAGHRGTPSHHPLQQLSGDPDPGQPGARRLLRHRARGDDGGLGQDAPPGYGFEWTGTAYQEAAAAGQTGRSWASPCCSPSCSWSASTRAG